MPFFEHDGLQFFYVDEAAVGSGAGLPVLLIHGFASNHAVNWLNTSWVKSLTRAGRRVIALDNRGHGASDKPHDPIAYHTGRMAADARALIDHLGLTHVHVMGYSMGARIAAFLARAAPNEVRSIVLGGLGIHLVEGGGLPQSVGPALSAPSLADVTDPIGRLFRRFADANGSDLEALVACIRGSRQSLTADEIADIRLPALVAVGDQDPIAGDPHRLAALLPRGRALDIPGRDHNLAVGDKIFKAAVLDFMAAADDGS